MSEPSQSEQKEREQKETAPLSPDIKHAIEMKRCRAMIRLQVYKTKMKVIEQLQSIRVKTTGRTNTQTMILGSYANKSISSLLGQTEEEIPTQPPHLKNETYVPYPDLTFEHDTSEDKIVSISSKYLNFLIDKVAEDAVSKSNQ